MSFFIGGWCMARTKQTHRAIAPNGDAVTLSCVTETMQDDWFWHARMTSKTLAIGVSVGTHEYAEYGIAHNDYTVTQTVQYRGRPLLVAVSPDRLGWQVVWNGPYHSMIFGGAGSAPALRAIVELLDQITLKDSPAGLEIKPQPGSDIVMWSLYGVKFTDSGMVTIYPRDDAAALIPKQEGLAVAQGTVWKKTVDAADGKASLGKYLHAGTEAVAMINDDLGRNPDVTADGQEQLLATLDIRWSR